MKNYLGGLSAEHFVYCIFVLGLNRLQGSRQTVARTFCLQNVLGGVLWHRY